MKKILKITTTLLLIFALLTTTVLLFGCQGESEAEKEAKVQAKYLEQQNLAEETVANTEMHDYNYHYANLSVTKNEEHMAPLDESANYYITCTDTTDTTAEKSLIYVYQDITYDVNKSYRLCDLYSATPLDQIPSDAKIFVYCHAGGWIMGSRHSEYDTIMPSLVKAGFVVFSVEYALLCGINQGAKVQFSEFSPQGLITFANQFVSPEINVSYEDMMEDLSAFFTFLTDDFMVAHNITSKKVAVGGYSAGGHLATLYSYHYHSATSKVKIAFCFSLAGPVTLTDEGYQYLVENAKDKYGQLFGLLKNTIAAIVKSDTPINLGTYAGIDTLLECLGKYQASTYIDKNTIPSILCYSKKGVEGWNFFPAENDGLIPFTVYKNYTAKLTANRVVHTDLVIDTHTHLNISGSKVVQKFLAQNCKAYAQLYMD